MTLSRKYVDIHEPDIGCFCHLCSPNRKQRKYKFRVGKRREKMEAMREEE